MRGLLTTSARLRTATIAVLVALVAVGCGSASESSTVSTTTVASTLGSPNILVVMTDDQEPAFLNRTLMPKTMKLVADRGTLFTDNVVSSPECCPSRATFLTGQYGHNDGVMSNSPGYPALEDSETTLPAWLQQAGYRTALVGKFLNGYLHREGPAPGFDDWRVVKAESYYDYAIKRNNGYQTFGQQRDDYVTSVLTATTQRLIRDYAGEDQPFFLWLAEIAPHSDHGASRGPCTDAALALPRDLRAVSKMPSRLPRSFNEAKISDKPGAIGRLPPLNHSHIVKAEQRMRCREAALLDVDRGVDEIFRTLRDSGELDRTVVIFTSDNGYLLGQHRVPKGKAFPYEESIGVPLAIRVPNRYLDGGATGQVGDLVANVDLAPTILDLAHARPCDASGSCRVTDGRSLVPLIEGRRQGWPPDRAIPIELNDPRASLRFPCTYTGVRTATGILVRYTRQRDPESRECEPLAHSQVEQYDLRTDPAELRNLATSNSRSAIRLRHDLSRRLRQLRGCAGIKERDPRPASGNYCD